ncbi:hypothetical protein [Actinoplanes awajinensis]|uniref:Uncharacterized protein n=1 Tax=Actinoplanes awajinensis subsp. mycoplanecinus TaxID=135947 RepID=A0A101J8W2_9ACTN|nr:hypothetical protein [Actinoplanes awajinensis]KUL22358.1 hypothetical protein ADL15_48360 [Actinoplanes awajinensis subsp. mycoplanecinus]
MSQDVSLQVLLAGVWTDVPLYTATPASFSWGNEAYGTSWPYPSEITCEIDNDSLDWDPARPESPIYGVAGRATPARLRIDGTTYVYGEANSWVPDRTPEHQPGQHRGRSWVSFTANGQLDRISGWTDPVRSPMFRTISARATSLGHWPLEDPRYARTLTNTLAAGKAGTVKGAPSLEESERPFGAASTVRLSADTQLAGTFKSASSTAGWQISFSFLADALPGSGVYGRILRWTTSNGYTWLAEFTDTAWRWSCADVNGVSLQSSNITFTAAPPTSWVTMRFKVSQSGGNVVVEPAWYQQGATAPLGTTDGFVGTVGALRGWWHDGNATADGSWLSHVFAVTGVADDLQSADALMVFNGYTGERALDRYTRNLADIGLSGGAFYTGGVAPSTMKMGPQPIDTVANILKDIVQTDGGRINDEPTVAGMRFFTRRGSYSRTPDATFDYAAGQIAIPFRRLTDTSNVVNTITIKNGDQGEYTASLTSGLNSTQPPPAGISEKRGSLDVNLYAASDVTERANWELARLTTEGPRYGEFTVDLLANPGLIATVAALRPGHHVVITGYPPDDIHLLVTGMKGVTGAIERRVTIQVEPYEAYRVGIWDATDWRWDTATTTLASAATSTATSLALTTSNLADVLTTAPASLPLDLMIGGERVTATAITAPVPSGGTYLQTITAIRSVNGVIKAQSAGTQVTVNDYKRWGL